MRARVAAAIIAVAAVISASGCARNIGSGIVEGAHSRQDDFRDIGRALTAGVATGLSDAQPELERALTTIDHHLDSTIDRNLDSLESRMLRMEDSLGSFLRDDARETLNLMVADNLALLRAELRMSVRLWLTEAGASLETAIMPALTRGAARAIDTAALRFASNIDSGPLGRAVTNLGKNLVRESAEQLRTAPTPTWVKIAGALLLLLALAALATLALKLHRGFTNRNRALSVVARTIRDQPNAAALAQQVQRDIQDLGPGVEPWFNTWLKEEQVAVATSQPLAAEGAR